jgi:aspartate/methionine/tyrosine aminotransferase
MIVDEVFIDYPLPRRGRPPRGEDPGRTTPNPPLTFRLGGLSKSAGLPQVKLGWIAVEGDSTMVAGALERLEIICDTYLSVSTPVQIAAPQLIEAGAAARAAILARIGRNYAVLEDAVAGRPAVELLQADGGWSAVLRVPATRSEEQLVLELAEQDGVLVHPGYFFDFPHEAFLVISLLPEPAEFDDGVRRVLSRCDG